MDKITWHPLFELGIREIDLQHHYFVDLINRLAVELGAAEKTYQSRLIRELDAYARFHFISEENLMYRAGYPDLEQHARHHFALIDDLNIKETRFASGSIPASEVTAFLADWFIHHTIEEDRRFAEYLQRTSSAES